MLLTPQLLDSAQPGKEAQQFGVSLRSKVVGQDEAIREVVEIYQTFLMGMSPRTQGTSSVGFPDRIPGNRSRPASSEPAGQGILYRPVASSNIGTCCLLGSAVADGEQLFTRSRSFGVRITPSIPRG